MIAINRVRVRIAGGKLQPLTWNALSDAYELGRESKSVLWAIVVGDFLGLLTGLVLGAWLL